MKRIFAVAVLLSLGFTLSAFAHEGEIHTYMGTVSSVDGDGSFTLATTKGTTKHVLLSNSTTYTHSDGHAAKRSEIKKGTRVVVRISKDGKTALNVKMAPTKKS